MTKVTVTLGSSRPGGVDIALRGLAEQTFKDFEIIFVDGRYHKRHAKVLDYVEHLGIRQPFIHVPNHRYNGLWGANCAGVNTGFMLSEGEIVIMLLDYAYAPPTWIEEHLKLHDKKRLVMAPHLYTQLPDVVTLDGAVPIKFSGGPETTIDNIVKQKENFDEICIFKKPFEPSWMETLEVFKWPNQDPKIARTPGPAQFDLMHTKNDSFPLETVLDINGMDENFDKGRGPGDTEFGYRLNMAGCECWLSHEAKVFCLNPREIMPNLNMTVPVEWGERKFPIVDRWSYNEGMAYMKQRQAEIVGGKPPRANNPYDMRKKRKEIWEWRELSQRRTPVIPCNYVPDVLYFNDRVI